MKINILDAHDRLKHFKKQSNDIDECCSLIIKQRPYGDHPFYIFAHLRTDEDGFTKRMIWQPRLTKPKSQSNSMLFKAYPGTDIIKIIWILPSRELWGQYELGKLTENITVLESINMFENNREKLDAKEEDDLDDKTIDKIYQDIARNVKSKQGTSEVSLIL